MSTIVNNSGGRKRRHAAGPNGKPLCGGGNGAKKAAYQIDIGDDVDCKPCLAILAKQQAEKAAIEERAAHPWIAARRGSWRLDAAAGIGSISYADRLHHGRRKTVLNLHDIRLASVIVEGLNAVYPPPISGKTAPGETDYEI